MRCVAFFYLCAFGSAVPLNSHKWRQAYSSRGGSFHSLSMSDFAGLLEDYSVPVNVSDDVEMMALQDVKDSEEQESETHEREMDDLFGHDEDHGKRLFVSPHLCKCNYLITTEIEPHRLLSLVQSGTEFLPQKGTDGVLSNTRRTTYPRRLLWRSRKLM